MEHTIVDDVFNLPKGTAIVTRLGFKRLNVGEQVVVLNGNKEVWKGAVTHLEMYNKSCKEVREGEVCGVFFGPTGDEFQSPIRKGMKIYKL